jgi:hypothetical protein
MSLLNTWCVLLRTKCPIHMTYLKCTSKHRCRSASTAAGALQFVSSSSRKNEAMAPACNSQQEFSTGTMHHGGTVSASQHSTAQHGTTMPSGQSQDRKYNCRTCIWFSKRVSRCTLCHNSSCTNQSGVFFIPAARAPEVASAPSPGC